MSKSDRTWSPTPTDLDWIDSISSPVIPALAAIEAAAVPALDPTVMGWKERGWYLGPHKEALFDTNGNFTVNPATGESESPHWVEDMHLLPESIDIVFL